MLQTPDIYIFCWPYCFGTVRFGLMLGVSALQTVLHYITHCEALIPNEHDLLPVI